LSRRQQQVCSVIRSAEEKTGWKLAGGQKQGEWPPGITRTINRNGMAAE
jgi:hypothetical protein